MDLQAEKTILKDRLIKNLGKLSGADIQNVLNFAEFLLIKGYKKEFVRSTELDPKEDPILGIIGITDVEPFGSKIDQELYGL